MWQLSVTMIIYNIYCTVSTLNGIKKLLCNKNILSVIRERGLVMNNDIVAIFPERIKAIRKKEKLSQMELANKLGITRQSVSYYENGERLPDIQVLSDICSLLNCSPKYLLGFQDTMHDENADISARTGLNEESLDRIRLNKPGSAILNYILNTNEFWNLLRMLNFLARIKIRLSPDFDQDLSTAYFEYRSHDELNKLIQKAEAEEPGKITQEEAEWVGHEITWEMEAMQVMHKWTSLMLKDASKFCTSRCGIDDFNSIRNILDD